MKILRSNKKPLLLTLIVSFLAMQLSTAHIHLAESHDHDGNHHQHSAQAHIHDTSFNHADVIDSSHSIDDNNVVELEHKYNASCSKKSGKQTLALTPAHHLLVAVSLRDIKILSKSTDAKQQFLTLSTIRLRAPPSA